VAHGSHNISAPVQGRTADDKLAAVGVPPLRGFWCELLCTPFSQLRRVGSW